MKFDYLSGCGNSFLITMAPLQDSAFVKKLCEGSYGVKCDGMVFLRSLEQNLLEWDYLNCDGSVGEMCGNAARCVVSYLHRHMDLTELTVKTVNGRFSGKWLGPNLAEVTMPELKFISSEGEAEIIDSGVPHAVLQSVETPELIKQYRFPKSLGKKGANVTFYQNKGSHRVAARTFERGVESVTKACGTGAVAAAFASLGCRLSDSPVAVEMPGGEMTVELGKEVKLIGPTKHHFSLELDPSAN